MRFLALIVAAYVLVSWIPRCAQQLPQLVSNAASGAASSAGHAADNAVSNLGRSLLDRLESWWSGKSPAQKFDLVCTHLQVEGVDKVCPYFTSALQGATELQAAQTACYLTAAATGTGGQDRVNYIYQTCPRTSGDVSAFQGCVENYVTQHVESGDWANCMADSERMFESEVHTMTEPIACIPGLPKSWCTTQPSPAAAATTNTSSPPPTDQGYVACLRQYYTAPGVQAIIGTPCGPQVDAGNAACVRQSLLTVTYPGQPNLGQQYIQDCDGK